MIKFLRSKRGEGYVDIVVMILCAMLVIALFVNVAPVFVVKNQLGTFANELMREAEISGRVGTETTARANQLREQLGIDPQITWSTNGKVQLDGEITVTCTVWVDIGFFRFGSIPIQLTSVASGRSEVYWK